MKGLKRHVKEFEFWGQELPRGIIEDMFLNICVLHTYYKHTQREETTLRSLLWVIINNLEPTKYMDHLILKQVNCLS